MAMTEYNLGSYPGRAKPPEDQQNSEQDEHVANVPEDDLHPPTSFCPDGYEMVYGIPRKKK